MLNPKEQSIKENILELFDNFFSFYPTKILGSYGDGGFILTDDFNLYKKIKRIRFYGIETIEKNKYLNKYYANENGINSRLDEIQATILNFKLKKLITTLTKEEYWQKIFIKAFKNKFRPSI